MKNFTKKLALAALALTFAGIVRAEDSVVGKWKAEFDSQIGTQKYTYEFKMDGTNLVGRAIGERENGTNDVALTDVKLDKDKISFTEPLTIQDNSVNVEYSGTIAGDQMKLHRKVGDFAEYDIVATRVTDGGAAANAQPAQDSVAGKWKAQFDSQIGVQKYTYDFKVDGTNLTGTATGERDTGTNTVAISEGNINGDEISFVEPLSFQDQQIRIEYKGKISGDEIKFTRNVGDFATEELVAKRVKETAAKP